MRNTKLKTEEKEVSFINYDKLKKEIRLLENDKKSVISAINTQSNKLSDLVKEEIKIKASNDKLISDAKTKAEKIISEAEEKRKEAIGLDTELKGKIAEAEKSKKESDDLIKSNKGRENNLNGKSKSTTEKLDKLTKILGLIRDVI